MSEKIGWYHPVDESDQWDGFNDSGIEHFRGRPIMHLAREAIQNSLDAKENDYVLVKICLKKLKTASVPGIDELKKNIKLCYDIAENEGPIAKAFFQTAVDELNRKEINVLEISDYNTTGMVGPCNNGTKYYAFMKAKGQSRKDSETASGSYGIGKFAPYASSHIRTIFVSTIYENQTGGLKQLTQGKSILMSHDKDGQRRQGVGFWGICDKCRPVEGIKASLPSIIQKANRQEEMKKGTKLTILCFDASDHWKEILAVSVAENFFGAINNGELMVEIEDITLNKDTIMHFFNRTDIKNLLKSLQELPDEPNLFEVSRNYLEALQNNQEVIVEESERRELGLVQLRILIREGLPKRVCALRNGMFISDRLSGLKSFSDYKDFVAVVQCMSKKEMSFSQNGATQA